MRTPVNPSAATLWDAFSPRARRVSELTVASGARLDELVRNWYGVERRPGVTDDDYRRAIQQLEQVAKRPQ